MVSYPAGMIKHQPRSFHSKPGGFTGRPFPEQPLPDASSSEESAVSGAASAELAAVCKAPSAD